MSRESKPKCSLVSRRAFVNSSFGMLPLTLTGGVVQAAKTIPSSSPLSANDSPCIVHTRAGDLRGARLDKIYVFKGIRYGEDTSMRRFQTSESARAWPGIRDALEFGAKAPQPDISIFAIGPNRSFGYPSEMSEDCLFLNLWTPSIRDKRARPVMVWLHGGGWVYGGANGPDADGERLAQLHDIVMVGVTHRLGILGYSYMPEILGPDYSDSGNVGTLDIVLALQWIKDNISSFGGDPKNVMIFGVSGGGAKVSTLMAMPSAKGLFHRAAVQSGPMLTATLPASALQSSEKLLAAVGLRHGDAKDLLTLSVDELLIGFTKMNASPLAGAASMGPVVDGRSLPHHPFDPSAPDISTDVPMIIGSVRTESALFLGLADESVFDLTWETLPAHLSATSSMMRTPGDVPLMVRKAREALPSATASEVFFMLTTEAMIRHRAIRQAELAAQRRAPVYMYLLTWTTPLDGGKWGTPHGICEPLVMDNVRNVVSMFGESGLKKAQHIADQMSSAWVAFARNGRPDAALIPRWPAYDSRDRRTMVFDNVSHVVPDPYDGIRRLFESIS